MTYGPDTGIRRPNAAPFLRALVWFFGSGAAGLIYQIVWMRLLVRFYGSTVYATAAVLAAFMAGLSLGSWAAGHWVRRTARVTLAHYALLELAVGLGGAASLGLEAWNPWVVTHVLGFLPMGVGAFFLKALVVFPFMVVPTVAMGMTFPVFVRAITSGMSDAGLRLGLAYGMNTLGAFTGVLAASFVLIPAIGLRRTLLVAVLVNLSIALMVRRTARAAPAPAGVPVQAAPVLPDRTRVWHRVWPAAVYFLSGLGALTAEVLWSRVLVLHLGSSVYAFALMLALVLLGIGLGSVVVSRWADRLAYGTWFSVLTALAAVFVLHMYPMARLTTTLDQLARFFRPVSFAGVFSVLGLVTFHVLAVPTLLMGVAFPLGIRVLSRSVKSLGHHAGRLYAWNTLGAIVGAIWTPAFLLHIMSVNRAFLVIACIYLICGGLVVWGAPWRRRYRWAGTALTLALVPGLVFVQPRASILLHAGIFQGPQRRLVASYEGPTCTVSVTEVKVGWSRYRTLDTNGVNVAGTSPDLLTIQKLQGHLPLLMHPRPRSVLHIGFGSGGTAYAVSLHPVTRIDVVEIAPEVVEMARRYFPKVHHGVMDDPRVHFFWGDGRNYLWATRRRYDVILSDSIHPRYAGNGNLYTLEYFRLARDRLQPGGVFSMWLPTYSILPRNFLMILRAFVEVFPNTSVWYIHNTINNYVIVIGRRTAEVTLPVRSWSDRFTQVQVQRDLAAVGYTDPLLLLDNFVMGPRVLASLLANIPPHRDDRPAVEFESARLLARDVGWVENFRWLVVHREPFTAYLKPPLPWLKERLQRQQRAAWDVLLGQLAFLNCDRDGAIRYFESNLRQVPEHQEPWEYARFHVFAGLRLPWCSQ